MNSIIHQSECLVEKKFRRQKNEGYHPPKGMFGRKEFEETNE